MIDRYTMVDSVNDGITVRIVYEGRAAKVVADILAQMQFDIIMICSKYKYPPVTEAKEAEKVYKKVIEQAENFKKYHN